MLNLKEKLNREDIKKLYTCGCTKEKNVAVEYERLAIHPENFKAVDYYDGVGEFLREFSRS